MCLHYCWEKPDPCINSPVIYGEKVRLLLLKRAAVCTQSPSRSFFFLVLCSICAPTFHPHIKAIHHQDQNHCVSLRQPDLLVGFFCVCEFYDWGQGPGTHRYISDKVSLWLTVNAVHSLFAQIGQCELQGHKLMSLLKQTSEFQRMLEPTSCCSNPAMENTTLFIQDRLGKSVKFRVLLIKMCLFSPLRLVIKQMYSNFLPRCNMWSQTFWLASSMLDSAAFMLGIQKRPVTESPFLTQVFTLIMAQVQLEHIQLI